jgi:hypothetical protein
MSLIIITCVLFETKRNETKRRDTRQCKYEVEDKPISTSTSVFHRCPCIIASDIRHKYSSMTSTNQIFGFIKSRAKSVRESAASSIEKITETLDRKLKTAQEDLEE